MKDKTGQNSIQVGEAMMGYYIRQMLALKLPEVKRAVRANNPHIDPELISVKIESAVGGYVEEMAEKFNAVATMIVDRVIAGRMEEVRGFEERLADLIERTLLRSNAFDKLISELTNKIVKQ